MSIMIVNDLTKSSANVKIQQPIKNEEGIDMKTVAFLHIIGLMAGNLLLLATTPMPDTLDGPLPLIAIFIIAALSGLAGTIIGWATKGSECLMLQSREAIGNFFLSVTMSPTSCWLITCIPGSKMQMSLLLVVPVSALWGIGGGLLLKKIGPKILDAAARRVDKELNAFIDDDTNPTKNPTSDTDKR